MRIRSRICSWLWWCNRSQFWRVGVVPALNGVSAYRWGQDGYNTRCAGQLGPGWLTQTGHTWQLGSWILNSAPVFQITVLLCRKLWFSTTWTSSTPDASPTSSLEPAPNFLIESWRSTDHEYKFNGTWKWKSCCVFGSTFVCKLNFWNKHSVQFEPISSRVLTFLGKQFYTVYTVHTQPF